MVIVYAILLSEQMRSIASPDVRLGWWYEDLEPRMHMMADLS